MIRLGDRRPATGHHDAPWNHDDDPYSVETSDIVIYALQRLPSDQFLKALHRPVRPPPSGRQQRSDHGHLDPPYITGVPHRIKHLEELLDRVIGHDGVALVTASEIGDWCRAEMAKV
jgi:allantoinase